MEGKLSSCEGELEHTPLSANLWTLDESFFPSERDRDEVFDCDISLAK